MGTLLQGIGKRKKKKKRTKPTEKAKAVQECTEEDPRSYRYFDLSLKIIL